MSIRSVSSGILILAIAILSNASYAQSSTRAVDARAAEAKIDEWIKQACERDSHVRYLYTHADAYGRILRLRAAHELGLSDALRLGALAEPDAVEQNTPRDTGMAVNVSRSKNVQQNETTIAISRTYPRIIVAGANDGNMYTSGMPLYYTLNSGTSWIRTHIAIPNLLGNTWVPLGDPAIAAGADGTLYYAYIFGDPYSGAGLPDNFVVARSTNGKTWTNGGIVVPEDQISGFEDKEAICVDNSPSSPHYGRVYLLWVHFDDTGTGETRISYSDDKAETWSFWTVLESEVQEFGSAKVGAHGEVLVTYSGAFTDSLGNPVNYHMLYVSTDGGQTFESRPIHEYDELERNVTGYPALKGNYGPRCEPYMSFDVDLRDNSLHLVFGSAWDAGSVVQFYVKSTDLGKSWSEPVALGYGGSTPGSQTVLDRFCPSVTVNQRTGDAYMTCYSSERDPDNLNVAPFRYHLNGNASEQPKALDTADFDPTVVGTENGGTAFIGDYIGADLVDTVFAAAWTKGISYDGEVYAYVGLPKAAGPSSVTPMLIGSDRLRVASVYPNPVTEGMLTLNVFSPTTAQAGIELVDLGGRMIAQLWSGELEGGVSSQLEVPVRSIAPGSYTVVLRTAGATDRAKVIVR